MNNIRKVFITANASYKEWFFDYRQIISLVVMVLISCVLTIPLIKTAKEVGEIINVLEPVIAVLNNTIMTAIITLLFLLLISDFPRMEGNNGYFLIRTSRISWLMGKLVFSIYAILTFIFEFFIIITIPAIFSGFFANGWSSLVINYIDKYQEIAMKNECFATVEGNVFYHFSPFEALVQSFLLLICTTFLSILIMMFFNFIDKKIIGVFLNAGLTIIGVAMVFENKTNKFIFPPANAMVYSHNNVLHNIMPIEFSYIYFGVLIGLLLIVNLILCKKVIIQKDGER